MDTTRDTQDRWSEANALGMNGHRVEHALEPLLLVLSAERDRADRAEARLAEAADLLPREPYYTHDIGPAYSVEAVDEAFELLTAPEATA